MWCGTSGSVDGAARLAASASGRVARCFGLLAQTGLVGLRVAAVVVAVLTLAALCRNNHAFMLFLTKRTNALGYFACAHTPTGERYEWRVERCPTHVCTLMHFYILQFCTAYFKKPQYYWHCHFLTSIFFYRNYSFTSLFSIFFYSPCTFFYFLCMYIFFMSFLLMTYCAAEKLNFLQDKYSSDQSIYLNKGVSSSPWM